MQQRLFNSVAKNLFPDAQIDAIKRLTGGVSAEVHRLELILGDGDKKYIIVRAHRAMHSSLPAQTEYQLLKALYRNNIPVPVPLGVDDSRSLLPYPYLVLDFIEGTSVLPVEILTTKIEAMASLLVCVHKLNTSNFPALPARIDPLSDVFDYLPVDTQWDDLRTHLHALSETAYSGSPSLLHGDYWPENLLWNNNDIVAVLDWEDAAYGDPLSDVACCQLELRYKFGRSRAQQFTQAYASHQPLDPWRLALWQVYVSAAAQRYMGSWGLAKTMEAHMRNEALASIHEAGKMLMDKTMP